MIGSALEPNWGGRGWHEGESFCAGRGAQRRRKREEFAARLSRCIVPNPGGPLPNSPVSRVGVSDGQRKKNAIRDRKQPKTILSLPRSPLARLFAPRLARTLTARLSLAMDDKARELTPEEFALSEKRRERKERKEQREQAPKNHKPAPQQQPGNSRFLARPWIKLPEANEVSTEDRVRVMTWNVRFIASRHSQLKLNLRSSC